MKVSLKEIVLFGMFGALMYASKAIMEIAPNVHLLGVFVVALTVVYRKKALYPIYTYVFISGLVSGFATWWIPHLYLWALLWAGIMILPKNIPNKIKPFVYATVCALHGFLFGTLYAPAQALLFGLDFKGMISWIIAGIPWDITHGISNFVCGMLICPIIKLLQNTNKFSKS